MTAFDHHEASCRLTGAVSHDAFRPSFHTQGASLHPVLFLAYARPELLPYSSADIAVAAAEVALRMHADGDTAAETHNDDAAALPRNCRVSECTALLWALASPLQRDPARLFRAAALSAAAAAVDPLPKRRRLSGGEPAQDGPIVLRRRCSPA
jgi:hypothetical protein